MNAFYAHIPSESCFIYTIRNLNYKYHGLTQKTSWLFDPQNAREIQNPRNNTFAQICQKHSVSGDAEGQISLWITFDQL